MLLPFHEPDRLEAGCDEAGRGCLAGPVFAAAVMLPPNFHHPLLNDSKKLSAAQRELLRPLIEQEAIAWAVGQVSPAEIDEINILQASFLAMHRALDQLSAAPDCILVDGNRFRPYKEVAFQCFIKGDGRYASIAAASILAKTHRDACMHALSEAHPEYGWVSNQGYPTAAHRAAIRQHGPTPYHRLTFSLLGD